MRYIPLSKSKIREIKVFEFGHVHTLIKWVNMNRVSYHDYRKHPVKIIHLNFSNVKFLKPYHVVPLACLMSEYIDKKFKVKIIQTSQVINNYLNTFGFYKFCDDCVLSDSTNLKTLPLWKIDNAGVTLYPSQVQKFFEKNHFKGMYLESLTISLAELLNNVIDHAETKTNGYTFTQYNQTTNSIIICVCDFGIGIPNKINKYLTAKNLNHIPDIEALLKAFFNDNHSLV